VTGDAATSVLAGSADRTLCATGRVRGLRKARLGVSWFSEEVVSSAGTAFFAFGSFPISSHHRLSDGETGLGRKFSWKAVATEELAVILAFAVERALWLSFTVASGVRVVPVE
jgi:hypothetical protein